MIAYFLQYIVFPRETHTKALHSLLSCGIVKGMREDRRFFCT